MTDIAKARETAMEVGRVASMQATGLAVPLDEAIEVVSRAIIDSFLEEMIKSADDDAAAYETYSERTGDNYPEHERHLYADDAAEWMRSFRKAQSP
jgi:hypothetical protein